MRAVNRSAIDSGVDVEVVETCVGEDRRRPGLEDRVQSRDEGEGRRDDFVAGLQVENLERGDERRSSVVNRDRVLRAIGLCEARFQCSHLRALGDESGTEDFEYQCLFLGAELDGRDGGSLRLYDWDALPGGYRHDRPIYRRERVAHVEEESA